MWPTATFTDATPDLRNEVHYDLVVAVGQNLVPVEELRSTSKPVRQSARERLPSVSGRCSRRSGLCSAMSSPWTAAT